ncbi:MAG: hypothetical protein AB4372_15225 [Xenococcus sp. (in: cyanobacteria)]
MSDLSRRSVEREELEVQAYDLFVKGYSYSQIAYELKVAKSTAHSYVVIKQQELRELCNQELIDARNLEIARLDDNLKRLYEELEQAEDIIDPESGRMYRDGVKARAVILGLIQKNIDMRCKILGLYAPERIEQSITTDSNTTIEIDYEAMSQEELEQAFADQMRNQ